MIDKLTIEDEAIGGWTEDGGQCKIVQFGAVGDRKVYVRFQSYDEVGGYEERDPVHEEFDALIQEGQRYRVTIERIE